jgi:ribosomal protein L11 methyltransferase
MTGRATRRYPAIQLDWSSRPSDADLDLLLARLDNGALTAITESGGGWQVFFDTAAARNAAMTFLASQPFGVTGRTVDVPDDGWAVRSQASLTPIRAGGIVVTPPWCLDDPVVTSADAAHVVVIRPSMGFGTGHHASTRLALSLVQSVPLAAMHVLDIGTGSGVLAIAARKLGAAAVDAIDPDPDALASAAENLALNEATNVRLLGIDFAELDAASGPGRYGVVLANLTGGLLTTIASRIRQALERRGWLVASGIETGEAAEVMAAFARSGFAVDGRLEEGGWVGLRLRVAEATSPTVSTAR